MSAPKLSDVQLVALATVDMGGPWLARRVVPMWLWEPLWGLGLISDDGWISPAGRAALAAHESEGGK